MIKSKKLKELEMQVFEMEARIDILEIIINDILLSQGLKPTLDAEKWYQKPIDN